LLKIHLCDGRTLTFDLSDPKQAEKWFRDAASENFQKKISGASISYNGVEFALPRPTGFGRIHLSAEHLQANPEKRSYGGEVICCLAGDVSVRVLVHAKQKAMKVELARPGNLRFSSDSRRV
jgi:hypothetical protein